MVTVGALLVSYIFPLAIYFFLKNAHKEDAAYRKDCRSLLLWGLLLGFPVFGFSLLCYFIFELTHISRLFPYAEILFQAFVLKAFSEELMKYLLARKTIQRNLSTVSFLDLMAYTTIAAIGFELMEAFIYVFSTNVGQILVRGISSMHATFGLIMGFVLARGIKKNGKLTMWPAVLIATLIHGTYDFCLDPSVFETAWGDVAFALAFLCLVVNIYNFRFMTKARRKTYYTEPLFPARIDDTRPMEME